MPFDNTPVEPAITVDPVIEALTGMRELIEKGWIRNHLKRDGGYCLVGAYRYSTDGRVPFYEISSYLGFTDEGAAAWWNDRVAYNQQEVLNRIDTAIANRKKQL